MKLSQDPSAPRPEPRFKKLLRLATFCSIVGVFSAGLALRSAYGGVKDAALELGSELGQLDGAGSQRPILLNGEPIFVSSAVDEVPIEELLDRVEARCLKDPAGLAAELPRLPAPARARLSERLAARALGSIVRHEGKDRGMVACFKILTRYDKEMESHGWERIVADGDKPRRVYGRAGVHAFVLPRIEDERTLVSLVQMRGR